jgi:small subunit ribosomal protein S4
MARILTASCRQCRREGVKLFLKGEKCESAKCTLIKRNYIPGQHGMSRRRGKPSDYLLQLREKQKVKRIYGVLETQFRNYFEKADHKQGVTGEILLQLLETRLDNVVYRLGLAPSRKMARQLVSHAHFTVNGKKVNIPSYQVRVGDKIAVIKETETSTFYKEVLPGIVAKASAPSWLKLDPKKIIGEVLAFPVREELDSEINEQLIVELYSK